MVLIITISYNVYVHSPELVGIGVETIITTGLGVECMLCYM